MISRDRISLSSFQLSLEMPSFNTTVHSFGIFLVKPSGKFVVFHGKIVRSLLRYLRSIRITSRERPKSAPYPRLKNSRRTSNFQVLVNWEHFYEKKIEKSPTMPKKTEREGPLVSSGIVCYAGNLFGSVPWATRYILASSVNFVELLVELFWSVQVHFGL